VTVYGCSRTDAGVSARRYVANFHADVRLRLDRFRMAINWHLPAEIHVLVAEEVPPEFHARHSARAKTYVYRIVHGISPLRRGRAWEFKHSLDPGRMESAARLFLGTRDFRPFCQTRDVDGSCTIAQLDVTEVGGDVLVTVKGDRFLYKMVRRIVGALIACGSGRLTQRDIRAALAGRPFPPFQTAPAQGLLLDSAEY
jgi:tRNA pseudouridine38-40 synthase